MPGCAAGPSRPSRPSRRPRPSSGWRRAGARRPQRGLECLDMFMNHSRRVRELLSARRRRAESEGSVRLERPYELVEGASEPARVRSRRIVGSVRLERARFCGERLDLPGDDRALGEDGVQRDERAPGEIRQLGGPRSSLGSLTSPEEEPHQRCHCQTDCEGDPTPVAARRRRLDGRDRCRRRRRR
jgi:hypothetical protein